MAVPKITFYYDILSPFAYIAYYVTRHSPVFATCDIKYVPVFLPDVIRKTGNQPPAHVANKLKWLNADRARLAKHLNVPIVPRVPTPFPYPTLEVQRALTAIATSHPQKLASCLDALSAAVWVQGKGNTIDQPEVLVPILEDVLGKDAAADVLRQSATQEVKDQLAASIAAAIESGAFGLPWLVCTNAQGETEGYFGVDHLGLVARFLGLDVQADQGLKALL